MLWQLRPSTGAPKIPSSPGKTGGRKNLMGKNETDLGHTGFETSGGCSGRDFLEYKTRAKMMNALGFSIKLGVFFLVLEALKIFF